MKYVCIAAWELVGGFLLGNETCEVVLNSQENVEFVLTRSPDQHLYGIDENAAIGQCMLNLMVGISDPDFNNALHGRIAKIVEARRKKCGSSPVLVMKATGDIELPSDVVFTECPGYKLAFDVIDKQVVLRSHKENADSMKLALSLHNEDIAGYVNLSSGTYLVDENCVNIYSINFDCKVEGMVARSLTDINIREISNFYSGISSSYVTGSIQHLYAQLLDRQADNLRKYIAGFAALEILIEKSFKIYCEHFYQSFSVGDQHLKQRFLGRVQKTMSGKYSINDKFIAVSDILFTNPCEAVASRECDLFEKLKSVRDNIAHGKDYSEADLPVNDLTSLLRKYLRAAVLYDSSVI